MGVGSACVASVDVSAHVANRRFLFEFSDRVFPIEYVYQVLASYDNTPYSSDRVCVSSAGSREGRSPVG